MNEIEIKVQLDNKEKVIKALNDLGCVFSDSKRQVDTIFLDHKVSNFKIKPGMIVLRIREVKGRNILTLKQRKKELMESKEIEFEVSDYNSAKNFIETLGYREMVTVKKERITTTYKGFNICIDEVEDLGCFMEIEIVTLENDKASYYEREMENLCGELGIDSTKRVKDHYDTMLYEKNNDAETV